jgi:Costars
MDENDVNKEVAMLVTELKRLSDPRADGKVVVKFGKLFDDERCANIFEALVGTLRAAKKRKVVNFDGEMLFQGVHDDVDICVL